MNVSNQIMIQCLIHKSFDNKKEFFHTITKVINALETNVEMLMCPISQMSINSKCNYCISSKFEEEDQ